MGGLAFQEGRDKRSLLGTIAEVQGGEDGAPLRAPRTIEQRDVPLVGFVQDTDIRGWDGKARQVVAGRIGEAVQEGVGDGAG